MSQQTESSQPVHSARFQRAADAFLAIDAEDPRPADHPDHTVAYHAAMVRWLATLAPNSSEALQLAARCQHIRRWTLPRGSHPMGKVGYKRWRAALAQLHVEQSAAVLAEVGYDAELISRVGQLLLKTGRRRDAEVQLFEDIICLVFLEIRLAAFAGQWPAPKVQEIVRKTWAKMGEAGRAAAPSALASLPDAIRQLTLEAIGA